MTELTANLCCDLGQLNTLRQALKRELQATPFETREPIAQMLTAVEFHIAMLSKLKAQSEG